MNAIKKIKVLPFCVLFPHRGSKTHKWEVSPLRLGFLPLKLSYTEPPANVPPGEDPWAHMGPRGGLYFRASTPVVCDWISDTPSLGQQFTPWPQVSAGSKGFFLFMFNVLIVWTDDTRSETWRQVYVCMCCVSVYTHTFPYNLKYPGLPWWLRWLRICLQDRRP